MGSCREGFDLFTRTGRRSFFWSLRHGRFQRLMWRDTFGRVLCWLAGDHMIRQEFEGGEVETHCTCCMKWLKQDGYKWVVR